MGDGRRDGWAWDEWPQYLTPREREVLILVARGLANKEIAWQLGISYQTVKNHLIHIMLKADAPNRTAAVARALKRGWLRLDEV